MATGVAISSPRGGSCPARASCPDARAGHARLCLGLFLFLCLVSVFRGRTPRCLDGFARELRRDVRQDLRAGPRRIPRGPIHVRLDLRRDLRRPLRRETRRQVRVGPLGEGVLVDADINETATHPAVDRVPDVPLALQRPAELLDVVRCEPGLLAEGRPARAKRPGSGARLRAEPAEHGVLVPGHPTELEMLVDRPAPLEEVVRARRPPRHVSLSA